MLYPSPCFLLVFLFTELINRRCSWSAPFSAKSSLILPMLGSLFWAFVGFVFFCYYNYNLILPLKNLSVCVELLHGSNTHVYIYTILAPNITFRTYMLNKCVLNEWIIMVIANVYWVWINYVSDIVLLHTHWTLILTTAL